MQNNFRKFEELVFCDLWFPDSEFRIPVLHSGFRIPVSGFRFPGFRVARKKLHNARKHVLYKRTQIALKTKTLPIRTSNERIIIPKLQLNPNFSNLRGKRKLVRKIGYFEKSGVTKIAVSD